MSTKLTAKKLAEVQAALANSPSAMTLQLAHRLGVPEAEVIRALPDGRSVELDVERWQELFASFEALGKVHVIVSNASVTCETVGEFGGFSTWGEFFNVQSKTLDMHVRWEQLGSVFAVEKPSHMDGSKTLSIQFFDRQGDSALKVFVNFGGKPTETKQEQFAELRERFRCRIR
jgi:putative hemin transport protein